MRKTLAIILSIVMLASLCIIGVSGEEPTPTLIATPADFAAIATDDTTLAGNYKLTADIDISSGGLTGTFTGTFDGDGHSITITDTSGIFSAISGAKISNLVICGTITATGHVGALANSGNGTFELTNITNKANVSSTKAGAYVGGLIGSISAGSDKDGAGSSTHLIHSYITNCVNEGTIHAGSDKPRIGGLTGNSAKFAYVTFENCVNLGTIDVSQDEGKTALAASPYLGGIASDFFAGAMINCCNKGTVSSTVSSHIGGLLGRIAPSAQMNDHSSIIINCTNEGAINANGGSIGGIVGHAGAKPDSIMKTGVYTVQKCVNKGKITSKTNGGNIAGIVGYAYGSGTAEYAVVSSCINYGDITTEVSAFTSQILGYINSESAVIADNIGFGIITNADNNHNLFIGLSTMNSVNYTGIQNNIIVENSGIVNYSYADAEENAKNRIAFADRPAGMIEIKSKTDCEAAAALLGEIGYIAPKKDPDPQPPVTGDNYAVVVTVAVASVIGMGIAFKAKRKED